MKGWRGEGGFEGGSGGSVEGEEWGVGRDRLGVVEGGEGGGGVVDSREGGVVDEGEVGGGEGKGGG